MTGKDFSFKTLKYSKIQYKKEAASVSNPRDGKKAVLANNFMFLNLTKKIEYFPLQDGEDSSSMSDFSFNIPETNLPQIPNFLDTLEFIPPKKLPLFVRISKENELVIPQSAYNYKRKNPIKKKTSEEDNINLENIFLHSTNSYVFLNPYSKIPFKKKYSNPGENYKFDSTKFNFINFKFSFTKKFKEDETSYSFKS